MFRLFGLCLSVVFLFVCIYAAIGFQTRASHNSSESASTESDYYPSNLIVTQDPNSPSAPAEPSNMFVFTGIRGAIICSNYDTVQMLFDLYTESWNEHRLRAMLNRQEQHEYQLRHGPLAPPPDPQAYGCTLVPPGTRMTLETGHEYPIAVVTAMMKNGQMIHGVTNQNLVAARKPSVPDPLARGSVTTEEKPEIQAGSAAPDSSAPNENPQ
jgi:hypothetical protein